MANREKREQMDAEPVEKRPMRDFSSLYARVKSGYGWHQVTLDPGPHRGSSGCRA